MATYGPSRSRLIRTPVALEFGYDSEAYLGNNGFYTGVAGKGALSQRPQSAIGFGGANGATTAITFTNIEVVNAVGEPQTGWTLVTGDAESTDTNEWLEFRNLRSVNVA